MPNELLWVLFALTNFILFIVMFKLFGKLGIFVWIGMSTILANIQVTELLTLFGLNATLGNIMYGTIFLGTDALNELYGKKEARKAVYMGFLVMVFTLVIMTIALQFTPSADDINHPALVSIFGNQFTTIVLGSFIAFIVSQNIDVNLYQWIRKKLPANKWLWIRNNGSTLISQLIDTIIFVTIAFVWTYDFGILIEIMISTYVIKVMVAALDTPFIYLVKQIKPMELKG